MTKLPSFPQLEGLLDLARRDGVDVRPTLLRVLTDLYVQKQAHSAEEEAQYVELAHRLIDAADAPTRAIVAARLSSYPGAPNSILKKLAELTGYIVTPPAIPDAELNADDDSVGAFFRASSDERRAILLGLDEPIGAAPRQLSTEAADFCQRLETAALSRDAAEFGRTLQRALMIAPTLAQRIADDASGEPIVVAVKALGMPPAILQRVLLFINPAIGHSVQRVYELVNLYDEIGSHAAQAMVEISRGNVAKRRPTYHPAYWDDERQSARAAASPSHARSTRRSDRVAAQFKTSGR